MYILATFNTDDIKLFDDIKLVMERLGYRNRLSKNWDFDFGNTVFIKYVPEEPNPVDELTKIKSAFESHNIQPPLFSVFSVKDFAMYI